MGANPPRDPITILPNTKCNNFRMFIVSNNGKRQDLFLVQTVHFMRDVVGIEGVLTSQQIVEKRMDDFIVGLKPSSCHEQSPQICLVIPLKFQNGTTSIFSS